MLKPVATLSQMGWVTDIHPQVDFLLAHWVRSDKRQNPLLSGQVHNLPWILQKYRGDPVAICEAINVDLSTYFGKYFDDVRVESQPINKNEDGTSIEHHIRFSISFARNGARHSAARIIQTDGDKFKQFVIDNNVGQIDAPSI